MTDNDTDLTVFVMISCTFDLSFGHGPPEIHEVGVLAFRTLDAAKQDFEDMLAKEQEELDEEDREEIVWQDTPGGGAYAKLTDGEEVMINPTPLR